MTEKREVMHRLEEIECFIMAYEDMLKHENPTDVYETLWGNYRRALFEALSTGVLTVDDIEGRISAMEQTIEERESEGEGWKDA